MFSDTDRFRIDICQYFLPGIDYNESVSEM